MIVRCMQERMLVAPRRMASERWFWPEVVKMATECIQRGQYFCPSAFIFCVCAGWGGGELWCSLSLRCWYEVCYDAGMRSITMLVRGLL